MSLLVYLVVLAIQGLIFGALARLALPGRDPMSIPMTIGLGIAGSFIGGLLAGVFGLLKGILTGVGSLLRRLF